jgi:hypothetical protein
LYVPIGSGRVEDKKDKEKEDSADEEGYEQE